jgi:hypothetical protein
MFFVGANGIVTRDEASHDQGQARQTAMAYLAEKARAA